MKETFEVINEMRSQGIIEKYAIGGAVGATFYLEPSATLDVDIFAMLPSTQGSTLLSLSPIYEYLKARGYKTQNECIVIGSWPVQFLPPSDALESEALAEAVEVNVEGVATWVMGAEHLVAIALKVGRPKDFARILQFLEQKAVNTGELKRILLKHGLIPKWEKFEQRYLND